MLGVTLSCLMFSWFVGIEWVYIDDEDGDNDNEVGKLRVINLEVIDLR